ncbi:alpha/beta fold hydrolase [Streptomyces sp. CA-249302]|uniref:alpha/beta fold hydrolase n=1 Tax=Streptomyces sp. CA-249302 TaxID=3240058 RepID=UPI003D92D52D
MSVAVVGGPRSAARTVVTDDGAEIAVYTRGRADAPATVVLCHGWTMTARDWRPHVDALARPRAGFPVLRVVGYDQRGHGRSTRGGAVLDMALLGRDLGRVLDSVVDGGDGPVVLVGHSMGGMAIQQLAVERPELFGSRVTAVGLFSTCLDEVGAVAPDAPPARRRAHAGWRAVVAGLLRSPGWAKAVHRLLTGPLSHPSTAPVWRVLFGARHGGDTARTDARALRAVPPLAVAEFYAALTTHDCAGRLTALGRVPTRVLVGARDYYTPPEQAARLAGDIPGAVVQTVPQQGHDLPYERPVLVLETVHALLREMAGSGGKVAGAAGWAAGTTGSAAGTVGSAVWAGAEAAGSVGRAAVGAGAEAAGLAGGTAVGTSAKAAQPVSGTAADAGSVGRAAVGASAEAAGLAGGTAVDTSAKAAQPVSGTAADAGSVGRAAVGAGAEAAGAAGGTAVDTSGNAAGPESSAAVGGAQAAEPVSGTTADAGSTAAKPVSGTAVDTSANAAGPVGGSTDGPASGNREADRGLRPGAVRSVTAAR